MSRTRARACSGASLACQAVDQAASRCDGPSADCHSLLPAGRGISDGYKFPRKQGIDDERYIGALGLTATNVRPCAWAGSSMLCVQHWPLRLPVHAACICA